MQFKLLTAVLTYASVAVSVPIDISPQVSGTEMHTRDQHFGTESKHAQAYEPVNLPHLVEREALPEPEPQVAQAYDCPPIPNHVIKRGVIVQAYGCPSTPNRSSSSLSHGDTHTHL